MKNKEIKTKRKSLLPLLLTILIMLLAFVACVAAIGTSGNDDNSETVEVSAVIPEKKNTEISETTEETTTTEKLTTTKTTTQTTEKTTATTKTTTTTEPTEIEFTQLYLDFFEPYTDSIDELMPEGFRQANSEKFTNYDVQITEGNEEDMWKFEISDNNGNKVYMSFYPTNDMYENPPEDWINTLTLLTYYSNDKEISISDSYHLYSEPIYNTYDKNRDTPNQEVKSLDELKKFMFSVSEKTSETTTTETVTTTTAAQLVTEAPTESPATEPPPPPEPVHPVVAESDYVLNTSTMKAHTPNCRDVEKIAPENRQDYYGTVEDVQAMGYSACGHCHAW